MKRRRVFVSSTIDDLRVERDAVRDSLQALGFLEVIRAEDLPAIDSPSEHVCLSEVRRADAIVLVLGGRYGYVPRRDNAEGLSVTHLEYREARRLEIPVFAFVRRDIEPEAPEAEFITEVADYHEGLFRRTWATSDELSHEVRRSVLRWLAALMRSGDRDVEPTELANDRESIREPAAFPVDLSGFRLDVQDNSRWLSEFLELLEDLCTKASLPVPTVDGADEDPAFSLFVRSRTLGTGQLLSVGVRPRAADDTPLVPEVDLSGTLVAAHAKYAASACLGLVLIGAEDVAAALGQFLEASSGADVTMPDRQALLRLAAEVSAFERGERCQEIVCELLRLPLFDESTVNAAVLCLVSASLRYEFSGAATAVEKTGELAFEFLMAALDRSDAKPALLYNLAREALRFAPGLALSFLEELVSVDPSYDERWYFHRDLGLIAYQDDQFQTAQEHYDRACELKPEDSELWRQGGDARYYSGQWAQALIRYEKALSVEPMEECFLDFKIAYCRERITAGEVEDRQFHKAFSKSASVALAGIAADNRGRQRKAEALFRRAKALCPLSLDADCFLALYANRKGDFESAIEHLRGALSAVPEDVVARLNLVANIVFRDGSVFGAEARHNVRVALFHGEPAVLDRLAVQLMATDSREQLMGEMAAVLEAVTRERALWIERRNALHAPERFGSTIHLEFRK